MDSQADPMLLEALMLFSSEDSDDDGGTADAKRQLAIGSTRQAQATASSTTQAASTRRRSNLPNAARSPRRWKRSSKCTYAARREEVARLRPLSAHLETQLQDLQQDRHRRHHLARQHVQHEHVLLAQAQHENARLHELLAAGEVRIRVAQQQQQQ